MSGEYRVGNHIVIRAPGNSVLDGLELRATDIGDGQYLRRLGNTIVGGAGGAGGFPTLPFIMRGGEVLTYPSIQGAIDDAQTGETIYVPAGVYYERLVVAKIISIVGIGGVGAQRVVGGVECSTGSRFECLRFEMEPGGDGWTLVNLSDVSSPIFSFCEFSVDTPYIGTMVRISNWARFENCFFIRTSGDTGSVDFVATNASSLFFVYSTVYSTSTLFNATFTGGCAAYSSHLHGAAWGSLSSITSVCSTFSPYPADCTVFWRLLPLSGSATGEVPNWNGSDWTVSRLPFVHLADTPASYIGSAGKFVRVKADESGLEFASAEGGGEGFPTTVFSILNGEITLYGDLDEAIGQAPAGSIIVVPPGNWQISQYHSRTSDVDVVGIGAPSVVIGDAGGVGVSGARSRWAGLKITKQFVNINPPSSNIAFWLSGDGSELVLDGCALDTEESERLVQFVYLSGTSGKATISRCTARGCNSVVGLEGSGEVYLLHSLFSGCNSVIASAPGVNVNAVVSGCVCVAVISVLNGDITADVSGSILYPPLGSEPASYFIPIPVSGSEAGEVVRWDGGQWRVGRAAFTDLSDTPGDYSGAAGYFVRVDGIESGLEFVHPSLAVEPHASRHEQGGDDVIDVSGLAGVLSQPQKVRLLLGNEPVGEATTVNLIPGSGVTIQAQQVGDQINITVSATGGGGTSTALFTYEGVLAVTQGQLRIYNRTGVDMTIREVFLSVSTPPAGQAIIVDINLNGGTIFPNPDDRPRIEAGQYTGAASNLGVGFASGSYLTADIDQVGSTAAGENLTIHVIYGG